MTDEKNTREVFDEVFDELSIRETTKQILKDDPDYFERILKNTLK